MLRNMASLLRGRPYGAQPGGALGTRPLPDGVKAEELGYRSKP